MAVSVHVVLQSTDNATSRFLLHLLSPFRAIPKMFRQARLGAKSVLGEDLSTYTLSNIIYVSFCVYSEFIEHFLA